MLPRVLAPFLRVAFHLLYHPFAFAYDWVSACVSRGHWRDWTRTAIPRVVGARVLEIGCGTGDLLLDLSAAGYAPIGVDLSPTMLRLARGKLRRTRAKLVRARAQSLPFADGAFDSMVMTFPPEFARDPRALAEMHRALDERGRLIWVDAGRLLPCDAWSRALDWALDFTEVGSAVFAVEARAILARAGFQAHVEVVQEGPSRVTRVWAIKRNVE